MPGLTGHLKPVAMFKLIELPYALDSLEPLISARTLEFHYGKHLQAYVDNLNNLVAGTEYERMTLEEIVRKAPAGALFNNAGQVLNHNLYFTQFSPNRHSGLDPESPLGRQINKQWGSVDAFKAEFEAKGGGLFGSGWVWLQMDNSGKLSIAQCAGADNPVAHDFCPLLTFDVWEHAYYLDYQNRRAIHLAALWGIVNWSVVEARYSLTVTFLIS